MAPRTTSREHMDGEKQSLLPGPHGAPRTSSRWNHGIIGELRALMWLAAPMLLNFVMQNSFSMVNIITVGHIGASELAAVALGAS